MTNRIHDYSVEKNSCTMKNKPEKEKKTFEGKILQKIIRDFTESEAINFLNQQHEVLKVKFSRCQVEKGKLMSAVSEIEYKNEKLKGGNKKLAEANKELIKTNEELQKEINQLQQENLKLIQATSKTSEDAWGKIFQKIDSKNKPSVSR